MKANDNMSMLDERKAALKERRKKIQQIHYIALSLTSLMIFVVPILIINSNISGPFLPIALLYLAMPLSMLPVTKGRLRDAEQDLKEIEFDIDLQQYQISVPETRAEKVLRINDSQLQRYYSVNLSQNMWIFGLGVFCILLGVLVIAGTLYAVLVFADTLETKLITGALGSIGSLLTSFVAVIYLKMHAGASQHLGSFHERLVDTHQALLSNLVASRIEDTKLREETLSKLALNMGNGK